MTNQRALFLRPVCLSQPSSSRPKTCPYRWVSGNGSFSSLMKLFCRGGRTGVTPADVIFTAFSVKPSLSLQKMELSDGSGMPRKWLVPSKKSCAKLRREAYHNEESEYASYVLPMLAFLVYITHSHSRLLAGDYLVT